MNRPTLWLSIAVLVMPALAGEGRIPLAGPSTINEPGHYVVVRDVAAASSDGITIAAGGVTLDIGGHRVTVAGPFASIRILADATDVTIRNGRLSGGNDGIVYDPGVVRPRVRIEAVEIAGVAGDGIRIAPAEHVDVVSCHIAGAGLAGIVVAGGSGLLTGRIVDNTIETTGGRGISVFNLRAGEVRGNRVRNAGSGGAHSGIHVASTIGGAGGNRILDNEVRDCTSDGIVVTSNIGANLIRNNVATGNGAFGIHAISPANLILDNLANDNVSGGIRVAGAASRTLIRHNQAAGNGSHGILTVGEQDLVEGNLCEDNGGAGLSFGGAGNHAYRDNMLRNNAAGAVIGPTWATDEGGNVQ